MKHLSLDDKLITFINGLPPAVATEVLRAKPETFADAEQAVLEYYATRRLTSYSGPPSSATAAVNSLSNTAKNATSQRNSQVQVSYFQNYQPSGSYNQRGRGRGRGSYRGRGYSSNSYSSGRYSDRDRGPLQYGGRSSGRGYYQRQPYQDRRAYSPAPSNRRGSSSQRSSRPNSADSHRSGSRSGRFQASDDHTNIILTQPTTRNFHTRCGQEPRF